MSLINERYGMWKKIINFASVQLNSPNTLSENIADSTGVRASFKAFEHHLNGTCVNRMRLPGLEKFDSKHLFFISFAHVCKFDLSFIVLNSFETNISLELLCIYEIGNDGEADENR